ncbi:outer membrane protein assembly factor BamB family protein [Dictyobacter kobayashii]|uniref:Pyrrolo-quinoline quinone repeat domain-containing protein n=1 Tax=Dictyobacter kobayashii TaxID=2014872 RepID=A0A402AT98_9CHLR|nr:PQQ-binding-like beta-propeller repeat protein [Dictyobacter kobayashii]GCE22312.1 hypothetical protein KDK_61120 [Dictyobacter kobayashii]
MRQPEDLFPPETIDEQIAYLTSRQDPRWVALTEDSDLQDTLNARLIHDLQNFAQDDKQRLEQTRARLAAAYEAYSATMHVQEDNTRIAEQETLKIAAQPSIQSAMNPPQRTKRHGRQRRVTILSGLVAILVLGSMLAIFAVNNAHPGNRVVAKPTTTPTAVKKPTPAGFYTVFNEKTVVRLDTSAKKLIWSYDLPSSEAFSSGMVVDGDTVYATAENEVFAIDATTGKVRWDQLMPGVLKSGPPLVWNDRLYAIAARGELYELRPGNGSLLHTYPLPFGAKFSSYTDHNIFYVVGMTEVAAIDLSTGQQQWKRRLTSDANTVIIDIQVSDGIMLVRFSKRTGLEGACRLLM